MRLGHAIPADYDEAARELIGQLGKTRWLPGLLYTIPVFQLGTAFESGTQTVLWAVSAALMWAAASWQLYVRHRLRVFGRQHLGR